MDEQDEDEQDKEEIEIIVDTAGDKSLLRGSIALQHDYIALLGSSENSSSCSSSSEDSEDLE